MRTEHSSEHMVHESLPGLLMLFEPSSRPDKSAVSAAISAIRRATLGSDLHLAETQGHSGRQAQTDAMEIIFDGLAFDFRGLVSGGALPQPELKHAFDCQPSDLSACEAAGLFPGPHLAEGVNTLPVVRTMLALGVGLVERLDNVQAICWTPAGSVVAPRTFIIAVKKWLVGGQFPAPGLFGLWRDPTGTSRSEGLSFFIDREIAIDGDLCSEPGSAGNLAASVVHHLVGYGAPDGTRELKLDDGRMIRLETSDAGGALRVRSVEQSFPERDPLQPS